MILVNQCWQPTECVDSDRFALQTSSFYFCGTAIVNLGKQPELWGLIVDTICQDTNRTTYCVIESKIELASNIKRINLNGIVILFVIFYEICISTTTFFW